MGGFAAGYKSGLVADDGSSYGVVKFAGRRTDETSAVASFKRPAQPLELYEFTSCPFCRKVREAVAILDLDVVVYPCPKGGSVWRQKAVELGGKAQVRRRLEILVGCLGFGLCWLLVVCVAR